MTDLPDVTYNQARHQLRLGKTPLPTVTAVTNQLDKPGLAPAAARETALFALMHPEAVEGMEIGNAVDRLKRHYLGIWRDKANRGTAVHALAMEWAKGNDVDCPEECSPYLDALERFYEAHDPQWVEIERNVLSLVEGREYGGQCDYIRQSPKGLTLGDIKTGRRYPIETTMQVSAYGHAQFLATYEGNALVALDPMPKIDAYEVLYLHDDTTYELLTLPVTPATYEHFLSLRAAWSWLREMDAWLKKHPEPERGELLATNEEQVA